MARGNGLGDLDRRIRAMSRGARAEVGKALDKSADEIVSTGRAFAPGGETGDLKASVRKEAGKHELARVVTAGGELTTKPVKSGVAASYDYALGTEYGTEDTPAQPFFWPAWRLGRRRAKNRISRAVRKAAKAAGWR